MAAARGTKRVRIEEDPSVTADADVPELFTHEIHHALLAQVSLRTQAADVLAIVAAFAANKAYLFDPGNNGDGFSGDEGVWATSIRRKRINQTSRWAISTFPSWIRPTHVCLWVETSAIPQSDAWVVWGSNGRKWTALHRRKVDDRIIGEGIYASKYCIAIGATRAYKSLRVSLQDVDFGSLTQVWGQTAL